MPRYIDADAVVERLDEIQPFAGNKAANAAINLCKDIVRNAPTISSDEVRGVGCPVCQCKDPLPEDGMTHEFYIRGTMLWYYDQLFGWEGTKINYCPSCGAGMKGAEDGTTDYPSCR